MTEARERRWGVMIVTRDFDGLLVQSYLPDGHRIIATKSEPSDVYDYHIIEGPEMPVARDGKHPDYVNLLLYTDDSGLQYGYWGHKQETRWLLPIQPLTA